MVARPVDTVDDSELDSSAHAGDLFAAADEAGVAEEREASRVLSSVSAKLFRDAAEPARIGRFTLIERIGAGGAGIVWAAYDPRLDRRVALKLLKRRTGSSLTSTERLVREAQVAGRLSHPNIVSVFDVGEYEGSAYLTMEYIDGPDLATWLQQSQRSAAQVLDVFGQAGRGLAEAHRNGVIHRDFKPANVMVQPTVAGPRARVVDFGLAGWVDAMPSELGVDPSGPESGGELTRTGQRLGTPAYMAPEQAAGERADARSDQFSFCLSLVEGLTGRRPFATVGDYALDDDALTDVPAWIRPAVARGLSISPAQRWPSMDALLGELTPRSGAGRRWGALGVSVGLLAVALAVAGSDRDQAPDETCTGAAAELAGVWDEGRRAQIRAAFVGGDLAFAAGAFDRVATSLDVWTSTWSAMHRDACEATHRRKEQSEAALDLRMACLRRAKQDLVAATSVLAEATPQTVENAHEVVAALPSIATCADVAALQAGAPPPDPAEVERVEAVRAAVAEAAAHDDAGELARAKVAITRAQTELADLAYEPVKTEAWLVAAKVHTGLGEHEAAEAVIRKVHALASAQGQWDAVRTATVMLMDNLGNRQGRPAEALPMRELALGMSAADPLAEAEARTTIGLVLQAAGDYDDAEAQLRTSLQLRRAELPEDDLRVAEARAALATTLYRQRRFDEAIAEGQAALDARVAALGPDHPLVASARMSHATILQGADEIDEAEAQLRQALATLERATPSGHPLQGAAHTSLAALAHRRGDFEAAEAQTRAAIESQTTALGPEHPDVMGARNNLAMILRQRGRLDEAEREFLDVLQIRVRTLGGEHPDVARTHNNLAGFYQERQRYEDAERHFRAALSIRQATLREGHLEIGDSHMNLAALLSLRDDPAGAEEQFRAALQIRERELGPDDMKVGNVLYGLANALRAQGRRAEATDAYRRVVKIREATQGAQHPRVAQAWLGLGGTLLEMGMREEGVEALSRAESILDTPSADPASRAKALFHLAEALWESRPERAHARQMAQRAADLYAEVGDGAADDQRRVATWLDEHR